MWNLGVSHGASDGRCEMGWSYAIDKSHNKAAEVNRLVAWQKSADAVWRLVEHRLVGNHLWMIVKHTGTGEISPALYLIQSGWPHHGWGHKSVSERDEVDMPLSLLALLPPTEDPSEIAWRERVEQSSIIKRQLRSGSVHGRSRLAIRSNGTVIG
jgi:hypothetical protein